MAVKDYKFFIKASVLEKLRDDNFSGLSGTAVLYFFPNNSFFEDEVKHGDDVLKEVGLRVGNYETVSHFKKPKKPVGKKH